MDIKVVVRNVEEPTGLRQFAEEKFNKTLERFSHNIVSADMRLEDETGPEKGGVDKLCNISIHMRRGEIHIKEQGDEFHSTINVALDRLKAALSREIGKSKRGIAEG